MTDGGGRGEEGGGNYSLVTEAEGENVCQETEQPERLWQEIRVMRKV